MSVANPPLPDAAYHVEDPDSEMRCYCGVEWICEHWGEVIA